MNILFLRYKKQQNFFYISRGNKLKRKLRALGLRNSFVSAKYDYQMESNPEIIITASAKSIEEVEGALLQFRRKIPAQYRFRFNILKL